MATATAASSDLRRGQAPGRPYMYRQGPPGSSRLGGAQTRAPPSDSGISNVAVSHHWRVQPWRDAQKHMRLRPGDQLFAARTDNVNPAYNRKVITNHAGLNEILRDGRRHARESIEASAEDGSHRHHMLQLQQFDGIRATPGKDDPRSGEPGYRRYTPADGDLGPDQRAAQLSYERTARGYVPSEAEIWNYEHGETADVPPEQRQSESEQLKEILDKYTMTLSSQKYFEDELAVLVERDNARERVLQVYNRYKMTHARYLTRRGITAHWNYLGTTISTTMGKGGQLANARPDLSVNAAMHGHAFATNLWDNGLRALEDKLYLILRARRRMESPDTPGSVADGAPFELVPWVGKNRKIPGMADLAYYDLGGNLVFGKAFYVGITKYDTDDTRPLGVRLTAAGLRDTAFSRAADALAALDRVEINVRMS